VPLTVSRIISGGFFFTRRCLYGNLNGSKKSPQPPYQKYIISLFPSPLLSVPIFDSEYSSKRRKDVLRSSTGGLVSLRSNHGKLSLTRSRSLCFVLPFSRTQKASHFETWWWIEILVFLFLFPVRYNQKVDLKSVLVYFRLKNERFDCWKLILQWIPIIFFYFF
jgi:hypothetical protein